MPGPVAGGRDLFDSRSHPAATGPTRPQQAQAYIYPCSTPVPISLRVGWSEREREGGRGGGMEGGMERERKGGGREGEREGVREGGRERPKRSWSVGRQLVRKRDTMMLVGAARRVHH